jgi:hypothetical protein
LKIELETGLHTVPIGVLLLSFASTEYVTLEPSGPLASAMICDGTRIDGGPFADTAYAYCSDFIEAKETIIKVLITKTKRIEMVNTANDSGDAGSNKLLLYIDLLSLIQYRYVKKTDVSFSF